ncbi:nucleotidyltransferase domain-containing protein [uncultured Clostridium sp.]|uniref:nucleotidyltransferase domain-containing protein n=1 Tax=uncultured Clostridium sp. TaxID=59620 RepID=UPI0025E186D7|nr:nucleotidyltransferase domain-containing protein [uncultured Clostridium sp.]
MKCNVNYELDIKVRKEIIEVKDVISNLVSNAEIYLFGSIAKGRYNKYSDIDILVLIEDEKTLKELRILRHYIEDRIEELKLHNEVDIKIYNKKRYFNLTDEPSFEQAILKDLIDLKEWNNG